jgi:hypothetical protein
MDLEKDLKINENSIYETQKNLLNKKFIEIINNAGISNKGTIIYNAAS